MPTIHYMKFDQKIKTAGYHRIKKNSRVTRRFGPKGHGGNN